MKPPSSSQEIINGMVRKIVDSVHPEKIILFGSYARGTAGPDSDVDLMVILPVTGSKRKIASEIHRLLWDADLAKDIVVVTPEDIARFKDIPGTIIHPALREGKVLYENAA